MLVKPPFTCVDKNHFPGGVPCSEDVNSGATSDEPRMPSDLYRALSSSRQRVHCAPHETSASRSCFCRLCILSTAKSINARRCLLLETSPLCVAAETAALVCLFWNLGWQAGKYCILSGHKVFGEHHPPKCSYLCICHFICAVL